MNVELILKKLGIKNVEVYKNAKEVKELVDKNYKDIFADDVFSDIEIISGIVYFVGWGYKKITQKRIFDITGVSRIIIKKVSWKIYKYLPSKKQDYFYGRNYNHEMDEIDLTQFKNIYDKVCPVCNKEFKSGLPQSKYCSKDCVDKKISLDSTIRNIDTSIKFIYKSFKRLYAANSKEAEKLLHRFESMVKKGGL